MEKMLIADNDRGSREALANILTNNGYEVVEAVDGEKVLESAAEEQPDLIVLDVMLLGMDGFKILENLKAPPGTEAIPVIVLTGLPVVKGEAMAMQLGAAHYMTKPWDPDVLGMSVRVAIRESKSEAGNDDDSSNESEQLLPKSTRDFCVRGVSNLKRGRIRRALEDFDSAIRLNPRYDTAYAGVALALTIQGKDAEVEMVIQQAVELGVDGVALRAGIEDLKQQRAS